LSFFTHLLSAQAGFIIGASGGVNNSRIKYSESVTQQMATSTLMGYQGQLTIGWRFSNSFSVLSGVQYAQRGTKFADDSRAYKDETTAQIYLGSLIGEERTNFISIPIVARYKFFASKFGFALSSGLSFNNGQNGTAFKYIQSNNNFKVYAGRYEDVNFGSGINDYYKPLQVSLLLGAGLILPVSEKGRVVVNANFDFGLSDVYNRRYKIANTIFEKAVNNGTFFSIGYESYFTMGDKF
jgi:Outer membrane protein beta-barrel domain